MLSYFQADEVPHDSKPSDQFLNEVPEKLANLPDVPQEDPGSGETDMPELPTAPEETPQHETYPTAPPLEKTAEAI